MNKIIKIFLFNIIFILILFLTVELCLNYFKKNHLEYDKILGWKLKKSTYRKKKKVICIIRNIT